MTVKQARSADLGLLVNGLAQRRLSILGQRFTVVFYVSACPDWHAKAMHNVLNVS